MKTSQKHIRQLMLEELNTMVENGELTEQQLQELLPGLKALGQAAWGGIKKAAGTVRDIYKKGEEEAAAQKASKLSSQSNVSNVAASDVSKPSVKTAPPEATTSPVPVMDEPEEAPSQKEPTDKEAAPKEIKPKNEAEVMQKFSKDLGDLVSNLKTVGSNPKTMNGHVLVYQPELNTFKVLQPLDPSAENAHKEAVGIENEKKARQFAKEFTSSGPQGMYEAKQNLNDISKKWKKYIKG